MPTNQTTILAGDRPRADPARGDDNPGGCCRMRLVVSDGLARGEGVGPGAGQRVLMALHGKRRGRPGTVGRRRPQRAIRGDGSALSLGKPPPPLSPSEGTALIIRSLAIGRAPTSTSPNESTGPVAVATPTRPHQARVDIECCPGGRDSRDLDREAPGDLTREGRVAAARCPHPAARAPRCACPRRARRRSRAASPGRGDSGGQARRGRRVAGEPSW